LEFVRDRVVIGQVLHQYLEFSLSV
jgi:hypothetical protein